MEINRIISNSYDDMPYESFPFPQAAPEHLQAVGQLFGISSPNIGKAKILELGCASGGNILPIAKRYPDARVVGIDLSGVQVAQGQERINAAGLTNVELRVGSITEIDASWGKFDYIICHGVYSWVPPQVQEAILRVSAQNLSETGIAYVSYNTYPGWKFREILRDAMKLRGSGRKTPLEQLSYARGMVEFLQQQAATGSALKVALDENMPIIKNGQDYYLIHEFLESCNSPCYFKDLIEAAGRQGLSYLAETEVASMFASNYPKTLVEPLLRECGSQVEFEQYLDFVNNRSFRQTLLVHSAQSSNVRYQLDSQHIKSIQMAGKFERRQGAVVQTGNASTNSLVSTTPPPATSYLNWRGQGLSFGSPLAEKVALYLDAIYPATTDLPSLIKGLAAQTQTPVIELVELAPKLLEEFQIQGHLRWRMQATRCVAQVQERPKMLAGTLMWSLPAAEAGQDERYLASNEWHESVFLNVFEHHVLQLSDGHRDKAQILMELQFLLNKGDIKFWQYDKIVESFSEQIRLATLHLDTALIRLARCGLLT
jgi:methyltransferase-like protein